MKKEKAMQSIANRPRSGEAGVNSRAISRETQGTLSANIRFWALLAPLALVSVAFGSDTNTPDSFASSSPLTGGYVAAQSEIIFPAGSQNALFELKRQIPRSEDSPSNPFCVVKLAEPVKQAITMPARSIPISGVEAFSDGSESTPETLAMYVAIFTKNDPQIHEIDCGYFRLPASDNHDNIDIDRITTDAVRSVLAEAGNFTLEEPVVSQPDPSMPVFMPRQPIPSCPQGSYFLGGYGGNGANVLLGRCVPYIGA